MNKDEATLKQQTYQIIGAAQEVHRELGAGFLEAVYQEALEIELSVQKIPFVREKELDLFYKSIELNKKYVADFICYDQIIVELKSVKELTNEHLSQVLNYLKCTGFSLGLLLNFGEQSLKIKRVINSKGKYKK